MSESHIHRNYSDYEEGEDSPMEIVPFWKKCIKLPVEVEYRLVMSDENEVETLEGFKPCDPDKHYIIRGIKGEVYPIEKDIFHKTYRLKPQSRWQRFTHAFLYSYNIALYKLGPIILLLVVASLSIGYLLASQFYQSLLDTLFPLWRDLLP
jgi:hypothetical protein